MPYIPVPIRVWPSRNDPHWLPWTPETYDRYLTQSWYTSKNLATMMSCAVGHDVRSTGGRIKDWTMWDPAAGSGRLYERFTSNNRYASDLRGATFEFKTDKHFYPEVDFVQDVLAPLTRVKPIYLIANPPYGNLTHQFINRAFDGTYPIKRGLFLIGGGANLKRYLQMIDYSKCVLVQKSKTFKADFEIMLEPRGGGPPTYRPIKQPVQLLLFYSTEEYENVLRSALKEHLCEPIVQRGSCDANFTFADTIRLDPVAGVCKDRRSNSRSNNRKSSSRAGPVTRARGRKA